MRKNTLCVRRNRRAVRAILSAVGAAGGLAGGHLALGQVVSSDNTYSYSSPGTSANFSTGFTPNFNSGGDPSGELLFTGTGAYTATDDLAA